MIEAFNALAIEDKTITVGAEWRNNLRQTPEITPGTWEQMEKMRMSKRHK